MTDLGFDRPLYILPFDHRGSFQSGLFGWKGTLTSEQTERVAASKAIMLMASLSTCQPSWPRWHSTASRTRSPTAPKYRRKRRAVSHGHEAIASEPLL
jgi:hypothetical protein